MATLISTPQELDNIRNNLNADYELVNDIDMSSWGNFTPIGESHNKSFKGTFNGNGFKIKNLTIIDHDYASLFGYVKDGHIKNLGLENVTISSTKNFVGGIVSYLYNTNNNKKIKNCYVTGQINGNYQVGGIVGSIFFGEVINSFSHAKVTGVGAVGGLVGNGQGGVNSKITNCYSTGLVVSGNDKCGGLVGTHNAPSAVTNSFWDKNTSGQTTSAGGIGLTTQQMKQQSTYVGWDFDTVWSIDSDYPYLQIFGVPSAQPKTETITVDTYSLPLQSNVTKNIKSIKNTTSQIKFIYSRSSRKVSTKRNILSYTLPIGSDVEKYNRTVKIITHNLNTYVSPINSQINRYIRSQKQLISHTGKIQAFTDVLIPYNTFIPNAYLNVIEGGSRAYSKQNLSNVYYLVNPSKVEVIK